MDSPLHTLSTTLKSHTYSLTTARKLVFSALLDSEPLTMSELAIKLNNSINRASIYRVISLFEELGIVERLQIGWKYKLELSDTFRSHHHHITCIRCHRTQSFEESTTIELELKQLASEAGFTETGHQLELRGLCNSCQQ